LCGSFSNKSRLAFAAAQPKGLAVKLCPSQTVYLGESSIKD